MQGRLDARSNRPGVPRLKTSCVLLARGLRACGERESPHTPVGLYVARHGAHQVSSFHFSGQEVNRLPAIAGGRAARVLGGAEEGVREERVGRRPRHQVPLLLSRGGTYIRAGEDLQLHRVVACQENRGRIGRRIGAKCRRATRLHHGGADGTRPRPRRAAPRGGAPAQLTPCPAIRAQFERARSGCHCHAAARARWPLEEGGHAPARGWSEKKIKKNGGL